MISITLQPSATLLLSSSSLHLMCLLKSACDYSAVQWTKDGQTLQDNGVVISNDVVEINSTTLQHSGNYCCELSGVMNCQYITVVGKYCIVVVETPMLLNTNLACTKAVTI